MRGKVRGEMVVWGRGGAGVRGDVGGGKGEGAVPAFHHSHSHSQLPPRSRHNQQQPLTSQITDCSNTTHPPPLITPPPHRSAWPDDGNHLPSTTHLATPNPFHPTHRGAWPRREPPLGRISHSLTTHLATPPPFQTHLATPPPPSLHPHRCPWPRCEPSPIHYTSSNPKPIPPHSPPRVAPT